jgi:hypothetical protein
MFELFSDIYFVVYKLYYISQNNKLDIRVSLKNWDRGSIIFYHMNTCTDCPNQSHFSFLWFQSLHLENQCACMPHSS